MSALSDTVMAIVERLAEHYEAMAEAPAARLMTPLDFLVASAKLAEVGDALLGIEADVEQVREHLGQAEALNPQAPPEHGPLPRQFRVIDGGRS